MKQILKFKLLFKSFLIALLLLTNSEVLLAQSLISESSPQVIGQEAQGFIDLEKRFEDLTKERASQIKEGSRPFILSQHKKAPTIVMFHGLSDSPGSLKEVSKVYFKLGYNVLTVLLRDHGLLRPYRDEARATVTIDQWREDIDHLMDIAFSMSDSPKVALLGYSLGGALSVDTADRYEGKISSLVLIAPLFKMNHAWAAPLAKYLKDLGLTVKKGIAETNYFYPDFAFNQVFQVYELTKYLDEITKNAKQGLKDVPKMMFLTDADTTVVNDFSYTMAKRINVPHDKIIMYTNDDKETTVLHRDLPMRIINASKLENPHIDDLLMKLEAFLETL
ncbi:MAG: alpha/beta hydrolase [Bacteriovorax sp.]